MSLGEEGEEGEEGDEPITADKHLTSRETPEPSSPLPVIISADGSATIDGVPVPVLGEESVDIAILDTLHGYARSRSAPVQAAISDPSAGYVAIVEVAPDGSSTLLEQHQEEPTEDEDLPRTAGDGDLAGSGGYARPAEYVESAEPFEIAGPFDVDDEADAIPEAAIPQPAESQVTSPALSAVTGGKSVRRKASPQSDNEYERPGLLQRPSVIGAVAVAVAAVAFGSVMALGSGGAGGGGGKQEQAADAGKNTSGSSTDLQPAPSYSPSTSPSPSVSASPSSSPSSSASASPSKESASAPPKSTTKPKPPAPRTAATAVAKLAAQRPGRHICYRVYLEDDGWQKTVCDGTWAASKANRDQKIKALNIAVSGTKGTAANSYVHKDGWKTTWRSVSAGDDNYIGSTKRDAPYMLGFAISVVEGAVCQDSRVQTEGWLRLKCAKPGSYIFGGTLSDSSWLQNVRFTV